MFLKFYSSLNFNLHYMSLKLKIRKDVKKVSSVFEGYFKYGNKNGGFSVFSVA
jgi:hypothetical protein